MEQLAELQETAEAIAALDVLASLAETARLFDYSRPVLNETRNLFIRDGRHPVLDQNLAGERFVPNDIALEAGENRLLIITGPNMAGKSTYIRQVALLTLMAQIGSFVPAASAEIGLVDRIFTRVGASDDLSRGQSTFMVEMNETAHDPEQRHRPQPRHPRRNRPRHLHLRRPQHRLERRRASARRDRVRARSSPRTTTSSPRSRTPAPA